MSKQNKLIFFLSTGRSGTKWLAKNFDAVYGDVARVVHEPVPLKKRLGLCYLKSVRDPAFCEEVYPDIASWAQLIDRTLNEKSFIWTGWDCYSLIPYFVHKLGRDRVSVVALRRSWQNHLASLLRSTFYDDNNFNIGQHPTPLKNEHLYPTDPDFMGLTTQDRKSWYMAEIIAYGDFLRKTYPNLHFFNFFIDHVFNSSRLEMKSLIRFMELDWREEFFERSTIKEDSVIFNNSRGLDVNLLT